MHACYRLYTRCCCCCHYCCTAAHVSDGAERNDANSTAGTINSAPHCYSVANQGFTNIITSCRGEREAPIARTRHREAPIASTRHREHLDAGHASQSCCRCNPTVSH